MNIYGRQILKNNKLVTFYMNCRDIYERSEHSTLRENRNRESIKIDAVSTSLFSLASFSG